MNEETKILINSKMHQLFMAKGKREPEKKMAILWIKYLESYPPEKLIEAFEKEIRSNNDFPTLGKILNHVDPLPDPESESLDAWNELLISISKGIDYTKEQFEVCCEVAGSISAVAQANEYQLSAIKKDFIRKYSKKIQKKIDEKIQIQTNQNKLLGNNHG